MSKLLYVTLLLLAQSFATTAGAQRAPGKCHPYWAAKAVFVGEAVNSRRAKSTAYEYVGGAQKFSDEVVSHITFKIRHTFSGPRPGRPSETVDVECGPCLNREVVRQGESYLVYAYGAGGKGSYPLAVPDGMLPKPLSHASADVKSLEALTALGTIGYELNRVGAGILSGRAISKPAPAYPPAAKKDGASGTVTVVIILNPEGHVIRAEAICGHPSLRAVSEQAALKVRYTPTKVNGVPVSMGGSITYNFALQ